MPFNPKQILVTGGAGFIGSAFIHFLLRKVKLTGKIVNLDLLTYSGNLANLKGFEGHPKYHFIQGDIRNESLLLQIIDDYEIDTVVHFAAESHVDRSISGPKVFLSTNVEGTLSILETIRKRPEVRLHHVSTDEVFGSLGDSGMFSERTPYRPNSPYSASKAAADHFVRAYTNTYRLQTTLSYCSNNYGPRQFPEKLIPVIIIRSLLGRKIPIYGRGTNYRDWLYVEDHADAIWQILCKGTSGQTYGIAANEEKQNLELVHDILRILAKETNQPYAKLKKSIHFVKDRPGHDFRYAFDATKIQEEIGWKKQHNLQEGLQKTVRWYLKHQSWWHQIFKKKSLAGLL